MRRTDALLGLTLCAFGVFVGVQVIRARGARAAVRPALIHESSSAPAPAGASMSNAPRGAAADDRRGEREPSAPPRTGGTRASASEAAPAGRDPRRDVPGTYFSAMAADLHGQLVRWPDRREQGLRIWVQSTTSIPDWDLRYAQMARDAFDEWGAAGLPLRFDFIFDSASADVRIVWSERFPAELGQRVGDTERATDRAGWIVAARIAVAIHDSAGRTIPPGGLAGIVRHEAGHALGLGHSDDPATVMYPVARTAEITAADRATLALLYRFPPGPVRD